MLGFLTLQGGMLLIALLFAWFMRRALRGSKDFVGLVFQGLVIISAVVMIVVVVTPNAFASAADLRYILIIPGMMTIIYAVRDLISDYNERRSHH